MSIEHYIVKYLLKANEFVNKKLDFHTKNTNNIDEVIKEIVTNFINVDNFSELDDNLLYHHLKASKALAQLAWNSYRDHMCYNNCEIDENYFYQICHHIENEEFYRNEFEKIKKGIKYSKTSIIEVISRYLITFCILISREVDVENKKICVYCDHVEIDDICSVCGGDKFDYKDVNCWPMEISTSNENKSSDKPEETNSNHKNETINCYKENLLNDESNEDSKLNLNNKYILKSKNDAAISEQCSVAKTNDCNQTDIYKIETRLSDNVVETSSYKESQLSSNLSNKIYEKSAKVERYENKNKDKENENLNKDSLLFCTCGKCSFNRNEEIVQSCTSCMSVRMGSVDNNENMSASTDINRDSSLSRSNIDGMNTNQWICSKCSLINNKNDDICVLCLTNKYNADGTINCYKENLSNVESIEDSKLHSNSKFIRKSENDAAISEQFSDDKTKIFKIESRSSDTIFDKESQLSSDLSNKNYVELTKVERNENINKDEENKNSNDNCFLFGKCSKCSFNRNEEIVQSCTSCMKDRMNSADNNQNMSASPDINRDSSLSRSNIDAMNTNQWICSQCSLINNKDDDICVLCYTNKYNAGGTMNCYKENISNVESIEDSKLYSNSKFIRKSENDAAISEPLLVDKTDIFKIESRSSDTIFDKESQLSSDLSNKNYVEFTKVEQFENLNKDKENKNSNKEKENKNSNDDCLWFEKCSKCSFNRNEEMVQSCTSCMKDRMDSVDNNENMSASTDRDSSLSRSNIEPMDTNQWICSQCSLINNKDDDICVLCYTNKSNADNYDLPEETWNCKKCNERNPFDCYKCYKCGDFSDFFDKWVCEQCSYFNHKLNWNCNVCNMKNQHLAKCPQCKKFNINIKYDDICFCCNIDNTLLKKFPKLSINSDGDNDNMVKSNNISSLDSINIDKKETNQWNYSSTNIERKQNEMKINNLRFASIENSCWYCCNPKCCGVNYKAVTYCDKCHLKKNSYPLNNTDCVFYKNSREIKEWYCSKCSIFTNSSSSSCSRCNYHKMKVTTV